MKDFACFVHSMVCVCERANSKDWVILVLISFIFKG